MHQQITQDTYFGVVWKNDSADLVVNENQWWRDMYPNLFFDDWLWANMIWGAEWLHWVDWNKVNDPVLINLFHIGILDWMGPNNHLHQATQAIQQLTAMHIRTFPCILKLENWVRKWHRTYWSFTNHFLQVDNSEWEWRALWLQIIKVDSKNESNHKEFQMVTYTIKEVIVGNNQKFTADYKWTHDWIDWYCSNNSLLKKQVKELEGTIHPVVLISFWIVFREDLRILRKLSLGFFNPPKGGENLSPEWLIIL